MNAKVCCLLLLLCVALPSHAQNADLRLTASASPTLNLGIGQDVLVTTTIGNVGPDSAQGALLVVSGVAFQEFPFEIVGSETPGCTIDFLDIDPVRFNYIWLIGSAPAGTEVTCIARLRVRAVPPSFGLTLTAQVSGNTPDPFRQTTRFPSSSRLAPWSR